MVDTKPLEIILTHEHTDFDALASLMAASFLFPDALPVLPNLLNRNVREFVALYKNQLPFLTARELPKGHVEKAIFVDTRSANWTKGMDHSTRFFVIDHHTQEDDAPEADGSLPAEVSMSAEGSDQDDSFDFGDKTLELEAVAEDTVENAEEELSLELEDSLALEDSLELENSLESEDSPALEDDGFEQVGTAQANVAEDTLELDDVELTAKDDLDLDITNLDEEFPELDAIGTKLDLARAYIDMGDMESATSILNEVKSEGNDEQVAQAESLLNQAKLAG